MNPNTSALIPVFLWSERAFINAPWRKEEPPALYARGSATFFVWVLTTPNVVLVTYVQMNEERVTVPYRGYG